MIYLISYKVPFDLFRSLDDVETEIKSYPGWCKCFDSAWLIATGDDIETVSEKLAKHFEEKDLWFIAAVNEKFCGGLSKDAWEWFNDTRGKGF